MKIFYPFLLISLMACSVKKTEETSDPANAIDNAFEKISASGTIDFEYMDLTVSPKTDFYTFSNGTWIANNPVPSSETKWGSFNELQKNNYLALKEILEEAVAREDKKGSINQLIGDFYYTYMDSNKRNELGIEPIAPYLKLVGDMETKSDIAAVLGKLHNTGIPGLISVAVQQDLKNNKIHRVYIGQGGMGLPGKTYYTKTDDESVELQDLYKQHISLMLEFVSEGLPQHDKGYYASPESKRIYDLEYVLAINSMTRTEMRNYFALYNKFTYEEVLSSAPGFDWKAYFKIRNLSNMDTLIVTQPDFLTGLENIINDFSLQDIKQYLTWQILNTTSPTLSDKISGLDFDFYSRELRGQQVMKPRWKRAIDAFGRGGFSENLGRAFVNKHFSADAKKKVNEMVDNIIDVYEDRINNLDWMTSDTKKKALEKLHAFTRKLGYPDKWRDFSTLELDRSSYASNVLKITKHAIAYNTAKLHKGVDKSEWGMAPHIVNAYYSPLFNEIVFPAGIMQPPFFDIDKEDAVNYARMGAVIGHELTHGFDDQGSLFSAEGEFENWWSEEDKLQFSVRTKKLENQFNTYEALPGLNINGKLTLGENIADFGGLTIAYYAYQKSLESKAKSEIGGFTNEQRFFIAFAQIWKTNYTENAMKLQVNTNPHSPGKWRVIGPLSNMPEFFEAFDVQEGDAMRQPTDKITAIW